MFRRITETICLLVQIWIVSYTPKKPRFHIEQRCEDTFFLTHLYICIYLTDVNFKSIICKILIKKTDIISTYTEQHSDAEIISVFFISLNSILYFRKIHFFYIDILKIFILCQADFLCTFRNSRQTRFCRLQ